jgi:hypothetical protein
MTAATRPRKPRRTLTPVTITSRYPSFNGGRVENWSAVSTDGVWKFERMEIPSSPWSVIHVPSEVEAGWYGSLPAAREATASGSAMASVERILAHQRGEHDAERVPACVRC